jgi:hypothetical protein
MPSRARITDRVSVTRDTAQVRSKVSSSLFIDEDGVTVIPRRRYARCRADQRPLPCCITDKMPQRNNRCPSSAMTGLVLDLAKKGSLSQRNSPVGDHESAQASVRSARRRVRGSSRVTMCRLLAMTLRLRRIGSCVNVGSADARHDWGICRTRSV